MGQLRLAHHQLRRALSTGTNKHALFSATATLVLGIMGSAVLVVSAAFAETGIICGLLLLFLVAIANVYTSDLLLRQCRVTGTVDYDSLTYAVGGPFWRFFSQFGIVILLLGTLAGGIAQIGEAFSAGLLKVCTPPGWLVDGYGRMLMVFCTLFIVAPLCLPNNLTSLDKAGVAGYALVILLTIWIMVQCIRRSFPAIPDELPVGGFSSKNGIVNAISSFGFAFYIQPVMLPMLIEMPNGADGIKILSYATRFTIMIAAVLTYTLIGVFSAAWFGAATQGNILQNDLGNDNVQAFFNLSIAVYLALSLPPIVYPTRLALDAWLPGDVGKHPWLRKVFLITVILSIMLLVGLLAPNSSGQMLIVTGATGVLIVSYLVPIVNHFLLHFGWARCQRSHPVVQDPFWVEPDLDDDAHGGYLGRPPPGARKVTPGASVAGLHDSEAGENTAFKAGHEEECGGMAALLQPAGSLIGKRAYRGGWLSNWRRVKYRSTLVEGAAELVWPLLVLAVGLFVSISALTLVHDA